MNFAIGDRVRFSQKFLRRKELKLSARFSKSLVNTDAAELKGTVEHVGEEIVTVKWDTGNSTEQHSRSLRHAKT